MHLQRASLQLSAAEDDDGDFVDIVSRLASAAVAITGASQHFVVHVDNWFGNKWLGFEGKILGLAGARSRMRKHCDPVLTIPPFHPHRVVSQHQYEIRADGEIVGPTPASLHGHRASDENRRMYLEKISSSAVFAWYSGETKEQSRASLMIYVNTTDSRTAWYVGFTKAKSWTVFERTGIADAEWKTLLSIGNIEL